MRNAFKMMAGSLVVYVVMASCAHGDPSAPRATSGRAVGQSSGGGSVPMPGSGGAPGTSVGSLMNPVPPAEAESGSRLKARFILGEDGSKSYLDGSFWDADRGESCAFQTSSDGERRCLPSPSAFVVGNYADAACTQAIVYDKTGCLPEPGYGIKPVATSPACYGVEVYRLGPKVAPTDVYFSTGGPCAKSVVMPGYTYWSIGATVPPSEFTLGTEGHD